VNYFKTEIDGKWYFPLSRNQRWSFLARLKMGYGNGYGDVGGIDQILPFTQHFTAGGADSLRGFENNTVGPRGLQTTPATVVTDPNGKVILGNDVNDTISIGNRSLGGNAMILGGIELIVPTPFVDIDFDNSVRTSLFVDAGNVWDTEFDYDRYKTLNVNTSFNNDGLIDYSDPTLYRASGGVSVQWLSPMGPMVFSFSKVIEEREGDDSKFFTFNIGQTF
jgi:outer membrane protein insertion porin family